MNWTYAGEFRCSGAPKFSFEQRLLLPSLPEALSYHQLSPGLSLCQKSCLLWSRGLSLPCVHVLLLGFLAPDLTQNYVSQLRTVEILFLVRASDSGMHALFVQGGVHGSLAGRKYHEIHRGYVCVYIYISHAFIERETQRGTSVTNLYNELVGPSVKRFTGQFCDVQCRSG